MATIPQYDDYRLAHMLAIVKSAFLVGFAIGGYRGGRRAALQFMAETQHAVTGIRTRREAAAYWKLRHARTIVGATKEGIVRALQLTSVAAVFVTSRHLIDHLIGCEDRVRRTTAMGNDDDHDNSDNTIDGHHHHHYHTNNGPLVVLSLPNMVTAFSPYTGQVVAAAVSGSLFALVAPSSQRLRYGLRGAAMGTTMAVSLSILQLFLGKARGR